MKFYYVYRQSVSTTLVHIRRSESEAIDLALCKNVQMLCISIRRLCALT